jgi:hypothetical protein
MSNFDSVRARGEVSFKTGIKFIFPIFLEEPLHVAKTAQGLKGRKLRKKFVLPIESLFLIVFHFFLPMVSHFKCDCYDLCVKFMGHLINNGQNVKFLTF